MKKIMSACFLIFIMFTSAAAEYPPILFPTTPGSPITLDGNINDYTDANFNGSMTNPRHMMQPAVAYDTSNRPHICYFDWTNYYASHELILKYAYWDGSKWIIKTVDTYISANYQCRIAVDTNNIVHISYYVDTIPGLKYARWDGSTWTKMIVDNFGNVGINNNIAAQGQDVYISYFDITNLSLKLAFSHNGGTSWNNVFIHRPSLPPPAAIGFYSSVAIDGDNVYISYENNNVDPYHNPGWLNVAHVLKGQENIPHIKEVDHADPGTFRGAGNSISIAGNYLYISYILLDYYNSVVRAHVKVAKVIKYASPWTQPADIYLADPTENKDFRCTTIGTRNTEIHITYYEGINNELYYVRSRNSGVNWEAPIKLTSAANSLSSLCVDASGIPHVVWGEYGYDDTLYKDYIMYRTMVGTEWKSYAVDGHASAGRLNTDLGKNSSLVVASNGRCYTSYFDNALKDLRYAEWNGTNWNIESVDGFINTIENHDGTVGTFSSIALDSSNSPHIVYVNDTENTCKYARKDANNRWTIKTIGSDCDNETHLSEPAIAIDSNNKAHIVYTGAASNILYYSYDGEASRGVSSTGIPLSHASICVDASNQPHISFQLGTTLWYLYEGAVDYDINALTEKTKTAIGVTSDNYLHIAYQKNNKLYHAWKVIGGPTWTIQPIDDPDAAGAYGTNASLSIDSSNRTHIAYRDESTAAIKWATLSKNGDVFIQTIKQVHDGTNVLGTSRISIDTYNAQNKAFFSYDDDTGKDLMLAVENFDLTPPDTPTVSPTPGTFAANQTISITSSGSIIIRYTYTTNGSEPSDPTTANASGSSLPTTVAAGEDTTYRVKARAWDAFNNPSNIGGIWDFKIDRQAPQNPAFTIAQYTKVTSINLQDITATGASDMLIDGDVVAETGITKEWISFAATKSIQLTSAQGSKTVTMQFKDSVGNTTTAISRTIILDTTAPHDHSIIINDDADLVCDPYVILKFHADDSIVGGAYSGVDRVEISTTTDGPFTATPWGSHPTELIISDFFLEGDSGVKQIFARFTDKAGNVSSVVSDSITLDKSNSIVLSNYPDAITADTFINISVSDTRKKIKKYKYTLDEQLFGPFPVSRPITASNLSYSSHTLVVQSASPEKPIPCRVTYTWEIVRLIIRESAAALSLTAPVYAQVNSDFMITVTPLRSNGTTAQYYTDVINLSANSNFVSLPSQYTFVYHSDIDSIYPAEISVNASSLGNFSITAQTLTSPVVMASKLIRAVVKESDEQRLMPQSNIIDLRAPDGSAFIINRTQIPSSMNIALAIPLRIPAGTSRSWNFKPTGIARELIDVSVSGSSEPQAQQISLGTLCIPLGTAPINNPKIMYYDAEHGAWEPITQQQIVDTQAKTITANVSQLGIYQVMGMFNARDLNNVTVYPNPFNPSTAVDHVLKIINLPADAEMQIFTITSALVKTLHAQDFGNLGFITWDGKNDDNNEVVQGVYLYRIKANGSYKTGKIALIR